MGMSVLKTLGLATAMMWGMVGCHELNDSAKEEGEDHLDDALQPQGSWVKCAYEDDFCSFEGTRTVAYGADGRYVFKTATDGILCNNQVFGDPIPGTRKACWLTY